MLEVLTISFLWDSVSEKDDWAALRLARRARLILMPLVLARDADAILLGAVGGPQWDALPAAKRPERGCWRFALTWIYSVTINDTLLFPDLVGGLELRAELVAGLDVLIVRELTGGIYFGERHPNADGVREATNHLPAGQIRRMINLAFEAAQKRSGRLCSVDKANVLEVTMLWRETWTR